MILSCQNISKSFGTDEILKNVSFHIEENEKAGKISSLLTLEDGGVVFNDLAMLRNYYRMGFE